MRRFSPRALKLFADARERERGHQPERPTCRALPPRDRAMPGGGMIDYSHWRKVTVRGVPRCAMDGPQTSPDKAHRARSQEGRRAVLV